MGAVYEAKNLETGRRVAVKILISELIATSSDAIVRFKREAKAASAIDTPHVAQILDAGRDSTTGEPYIDTARTPTVPTTAAPVTKPRPAAPATQFE